MEFIAFFNALSCEAYTLLPDDTVDSDPEYCDMLLMAWTAVLYADAVNVAPDLADCHAYLDNPSHTLTSLIFDISSFHSEAVRLNFSPEVFDESQ